MTTSIVPQNLQFDASTVAVWLDLLTSGNLAYTNGGREQYASRPEAGAALYDQGAVKPTRTPGCYWVKSGDAKEPKRGYYVDAIGPDLSCECEDHLNRAPHICKHIIAATLYHVVNITNPVPAEPAAPAAPQESLEEMTNLLWGALS